MTILDEKTAKELLNNGGNHVVIPDSVTQIGKAVFCGCPKISEESKKRLKELGYDFDEE